MTASNGVVVVLSTAPETSEGDKRSAADLAKALLSERLCACVNVLPGAVSHYWWNGTLQVGRESLLVLKTTAELAASLRRRLVELHPYEVPEVLELPVVGGHDPYLAFVAREARGAKGEAGR